MEKGLAAGPGTSFALRRTDTAIPPRAGAVPERPGTVRIHSLSPNPFNPSTRIDFSVEYPGPVTLAVYDVTGRAVYRSALGTLPAGEHSVRWEGVADGGTEVASGCYFLVIQHPGERPVVAKALLIR